MVMCRNDATISYFMNLQMAMFCLTSNSECQKVENSISFSANKISTFCLLLRKVLVFWNLSMLIPNLKTEFA